jgi:hypothetical protein
MITSNRPTKEDRLQIWTAFGQCLLEEQKEAVPVRVIDLCQRMGIQLEKMRFPKQISALSGWGIDGKAYIFLRRSLNSIVRRHVLGHELFHILNGGNPIYSLLWQAKLGTFATEQYVRQHMGERSFVHFEDHSKHHIDGLLAYRLKREEEDATLFSELLLLPFPRVQKDAQAFTIPELALLYGVSPELIAHLLPLVSSQKLFTTVLVGKKKTKWWSRSVATWGHLGDVTKTVKGQGGMPIFAEGWPDIGSVLTQLEPMSEKRADYGNDKYRVFYYPLALHSRRRIASAMLIVFIDEEETAMLELYRNSSANSFSERIAGYMGCMSRKDIIQWLSALAGFLLDGKDYLFEFTTGPVKKEGDYLTAELPSELVEIYHQNYGKGYFLKVCSTIESDFRFRSNIRDAKEWMERLVPDWEDILGTQN